MVSGTFKFWPILLLIYDIRWSWLLFNCEHLGIYLVNELGVLSCGLTKLLATTPLYSQDPLINMHLSYCDLVASVPSFSQRRIHRYTVERLVPVSVAMSRAAIPANHNHTILLRSTVTDFPFGTGSSIFLCVCGGGRRLLSAERLRGVVYSIASRLSITFKNRSNLLNRWKKFIVIQH